MPAAHTFAILRCPRCDGAMQRGHAHLRVPFWSAIHRWVTSMKATFHPDSPEFGPVDVLGEAERRVAYRCYRCGFLTLTGSPWTPPTEGPESPS